MWVVSFTPRPLYLRREGPRYPLDRRLGGPQRWSGRRREEKILDPTGIPTPTPPPGRPARSQSLYRLSYPGSEGFKRFYSYSVFKNLSIISWCPVNMNFIGPKIWTFQCPPRKEKQLEFPPPPKKKGLYLRNLWRPFPRMHGRYRHVPPLHERLCARSLHRFFKYLAKKKNNYFL
jgi:hypothetical protein